MRLCIIVLPVPDMIIVYIVYNCVSKLSCIFVV